MGKYFGTDGFRGEVGKTLTADHAYRIGKFLGAFYSKNKKAKIVIGKDTRESGELLETALANGICNSGADAFLLSVVTTPCVAFVTAAEHFDCGVMISASHNPYYDNGIKLINANGEKIDDSAIAEIEAYLDAAAPLPPTSAKGVGNILPYPQGNQNYIAHFLPLCHQKLSSLHVALDCANGSACGSAKQILEAFGATVEEINAAPNGTNINQNAGSTHIEVLCKFVKEHHLDAGFAFDGDADRCIAVDEQGNEIHGDFILYILSNFLKAKQKLANNTVVTTVMSNMGLYRALEEADISYAQTKVGDRFVYENMQSTGNCLGGEQSGHIILSEYATTGDGILTALKLCECMAETGKSLASLASPMKMFPQVLKNIRVKDKVATKNHPQVQKNVERITAELGKNGRILLRESGTEPLVRVMVEAGTLDLCEKYVDEMISLISSLQED